MSIPTGFLLFVIGWSMAPIAIATETHNSLPVGIPFARQNAGGPVCGLLCVRSAFTALHRSPPSLEDLLQTKYLGDFRGSTIDELCLALRDFGLKGTPLKNLSHTALQYVDLPAILHVNNPMRGAGYNHWVLLLGHQNGRYRVVDLPGGPENLSPAKLMSIWDGTGIIVAEHEASVVPLSLLWMASEALPLTAGAMLIMTVVALIWQRSRVAHRPSRHTELSFGIVSIAIASLVIAIARHGIFADGMLLDSSGVRTVVQTYDPRSVANINDAELAAAMSKGAILIDARLPRDYSVGYIPGSVNIPVYATREERQTVLSAADRATPIVVYCQSSTCSYADRVASALIADGFSSVAVYRPGWRGWQGHQRSSNASRS